MEEVISVFVLRLYLTLLSQNGWLANFVRNLVQSRIPRITQNRQNYASSDVPKMVDIDPWGSMGLFKRSINAWRSKGGR